MMNRKLKSLWLFLKNNFLYLLLLLVIELFLFVSPRIKQQKEAIMVNYSSLAIEHKNVLEGQDAIKKQLLLVPAQQQKIESLNLIISGLRKDVGDKEREIKKLNGTIVQLRKDLSRNKNELRKERKKVLALASDLADAKDSLSILLVSLNISLDNEEQGRATIDSLKNLLALKNDTIKSVRSKMDSIKTQSLRVVRYTFE